jgi:hypothetical protein
MPQGIPVSHCPGSNSHILVMSPEPRECMVVGWAFDTNSSNKIVRYTVSGDAVWVPEELGDEIPATLTCLVENSN